MFPIDRQQLQTAQAPLKQHYRETPAAALVTLAADGALDAQDIVCSVNTGRALVQAGLHPATGGDGTLACSGDMLLQALVACAGVTLRSVATSMEMEVSGNVRAEGDLDFRGTLGVSREVPVGFQAIRLIFTLEVTAPEEQVQRLMQLTERYCVVYQTLAAGTPVSTQFRATPHAP